MAAKKVPMLYLKTIEETQKESKESHSIGHTGMEGVGSKQLLESLLAHGQKWPVHRAISTERLAQAGYYSILDRYESLHLCD